MNEDTITGLTNEEMEEVLSVTQEEKMEEKKGIFKRIGEWVKAKWGKVKESLDIHTTKDGLAAISMILASIIAISLGVWGFSWLISLYPTEILIILCVLFVTGLIRNGIATLAGLLLKGVSNA